MRLLLGATPRPTLNLSTGWATIWCGPDMSCGPIHTKSNPATKVGDGLAWCSASPPLMRSLSLRQPAAGVSTVVNQHLLVAAQAHKQIITLAYRPDSDDHPLGLANARRLELRQHGVPLCAGAIAASRWATHPYQRTAAHRWSACGCASSAASHAAGLCRGCGWRLRGGRRSVGDLVQHPSSGRWVVGEPVRRPHRLTRRRRHRPIRAPIQPRYSPDTIADTVPDTAPVTTRPTPVTTRPTPVTTRPAQVTTTTTTVAAAATTTAGGRSAAPVASSTVPELVFGPAHSGCAQRFCDARDQAVSLLRDVGFETHLYHVCSSSVGAGQVRQVLIHGTQTVLVDRQGTDFRPSRPGPECCG